MRVFTDPHSRIFYAVIAMEKLAALAKPCYFTKTEKDAILQDIKHEKTNIPFTTVSVIALPSRILLPEESFIYNRKLKVVWLSLRCRCLISNLKVDTSHAAVMRPSKLVLASLFLETWLFRRLNNVVLPNGFFGISKVAVKSWDVLTVHVMTTDFPNTPITLLLLTSRDCPSTEKKYLVDYLTSKVIINMHEPSFK